MQSLSLSRKTDEPLNVLCLGAHCDDIEIGCGGTLLSILAGFPVVDLYWRVFTSTPSRKTEALEGASRFGRSANSLKVDILEFRDGYLPYEGAAVKDSFNDLRQDFDPDLVLTHYRHDLHQDHRKVSELTWNTFRNHLILEYEIPKWDGDFGNPDTYVELDQESANKKIEIIQSVYDSQKQKKWFTADLFSSLMRIRGMECNATSGLAEAFYARKTVVNLG